MKPATEILLSAAFVLTPEENWFGGSRPPICDEVCAYIAICQCARAIHDTDDVFHRMEAVDIMRRAIGGDIVRFNDIHTHAEVLAALYKAAELSEQS